PRGATASPSLPARDMTRLTSSTDPGRTRQRGTMPSTAAAESSAPSPITCSRPTMAARISARSGADTRRPQTQVPVGSRGAAGGMRGQELAGIHDAVGIEGAPEAGHEGEVGVPELERHAPRLVEADPVLAGDAAAHGEAGAQELVVGLVRALELAGDAVVVEDHRMQIAVARVEDVGDDEPVTGAHGRHPAPPLS